MIVLKSRREIEKMRVAGRLVADVLAAVADAAVAGVTTEELDERAEERIRNGGGIPAFKHYQPDFIRCGPFPATLCTSVNSEVVHGIPDGRPLEEGDLLSVDTGAQVDGYFGDAAITVVIGDGNIEARLLADATRRALEAGIRVCRPGNHLSDISHAVQELAESEGYSVVRRFVGHGIGTSMHEDPPIPNYGEPGKGPVLKPGMVLAVEPMVNAGTWEVEASPDYWRVCTRDGDLSAHFEHTIAITESGPDVLTAAEGLSGSL
ncbi:MAG: type I methionyl aminopeptidase [Actinobacteria bacterium]|nr:type I methionyl aminopeptidase [Actinomycetota bacterium]MCG2818766.1 type I methionyl aminopeptidase [Actinomycetes bacterium]MBU4217700.1 type I methionyl aminopeptidase [Actinomycetota bacterium]MBU4358987.1 type I methionyl aminopeptidase [Actinomycetota bacterium]MBU4391672.1 type I methionyl aminopeptidase [Actinomycetota bacterium]